MIITYAVCFNFSDINDDYFIISCDCDLCLIERTADQSIILKKRSEIMSKCHYIQISKPSLIWNGLNHQVGSVRRKKFTTKRTMSIGKKFMETLGNTSL